MSNILFIDDDCDILAINKKYFTKEGHNVKTAKSSLDAYHMLNTFSPDCIILDIMMPEQNGYETCQHLRSITDAPIIFLSGCTSENDKVKGLLLGADDYILKPYSFRELSARIQVHIRRNIILNSPNTLTLYPIILNIMSRKAYYNYEEISLNNREYELLYFFILHAEKIVTFEDIGKHLWGTYTDNDKKTIMVNTSRLRYKLGAYKELSNIIKSVRSQGYVLSFHKENQHEE